MNLWTNDDSYCACYSDCDCNHGDYEGNCQRWQYLPMSAGVSLGSRMANGPSLALPIGMTSTGMTMTALPSPVPPLGSGPSWALVGTGCCPQDTCGGSKLFFGKVEGGRAGCEMTCDPLRQGGAGWMNLWTNDDSYCACYSDCDCNHGDYQGNCQRWHYAPMSAGGSAGSRMSEVMVI